MSASSALPGVTPSSCCASVGQDAIAPCGVCAARPVTNPDWAATLAVSRKEAMTISAQTELRFMIHLFVPHPSRQKRLLLRWGGEILLRHGERPTQA